MGRWRKVLVGLAIGAIATGGMHDATAGEPARSALAFKEIDWPDLVPTGWKPKPTFRNPKALMALDDTDPRVQQYMKELREEYDKAPTVASLNGATVRLAGYVVSLEESAAGLREFLLVPYFGACIHTPPPPANQIVHVTLRQPVRKVQSMDVVWVSGTMSTATRETPEGVTGYKLDAELVEPYRAR